MVASSGLLRWQFSISKLVIDGKPHLQRRDLTLTIKEERRVGNGNAWTDPSAEVGRNVVLLLYDGLDQLVSVAVHSS